MKIRQKPRPEPAPLAPAQGPINATALIRGMFHQVSDKPQPGMGVFPPDWLESTFMPAAVRRVASVRSRLLRGTAAST